MTLVEVCLEDVGGAAIAAVAGAEAVEVCAGLADGGTTPTLGFVLHCVAAAPDLEHRVLVRSRAGDFVHSDAEVDVMAADIAADRMNKIKAAGIEKISFAWSGSSEPRQPYYYQVQGPTFLLQHNNTQNNANHIHSVWRDYNGDFGRDVLGEHLAAMPH